MGHLIGPTSRDVVRFGRGTSGILEEEDLDQDSGSQSVLGMFIQDNFSFGMVSSQHLYMLIYPKKENCVISIIINHTNVFSNLMVVNFLIVQKM